MLNNTFLEETISLKELNLIQLDLPQKDVFLSGIGTRTSRQSLIVEWIDLDGNIGYGECSCRPDPYFSAEFLKAAVVLIQDFIFPKLKPKQTYKDLLEVLSRVRGWNFTKYAVEAAAYQVIRQKSPQVSMFETLAINPIDKIPAGISIGIHHDIEKFKSRVQKAINTAYRRLKFKISPSTDLSLFDAIKPLLQEADMLVSFDANGSFHLQHFDILAYFIAFDASIEQPFPPDRFDIYLAAKKQFPKLKVCFDEEVENLGDLVKLHKLGAIDELNLKPGRVGGIYNSIQIIQYCQVHKIPCWIGGMFETGIGRSLNLNFAAHLPDAKAHDLSPSDRYFIEDIISPPIKMDQGLVDINSSNNAKVVPTLLEKYTIKRISLVQESKIEC